MIPHLLLLAWFFQADPTFTIGGRVVDRVDGRPLSGAHVFLAGAKTDSVITGADGRFRFTRLRQGKYNLTAERLGYVRQGYQQRALGVTFYTGVVTGEHEATEDLVFGLIPGGVIAGTVADVQGNPVVGMRVLAYRVMGLGTERHMAPYFFPATTDDRGQYRISSLISGSWIVAFTGWTTQTPQLPSVMPEAFPTTYFPGTTVAAQAAAVSVEPGKEVRADAVLRPVAAVEVRGQVVLPNLTAGSRVTLSAPGPFGSEPSIVQTAVTGNQFVFGGVPEGPYIVTLSDDQNRPTGRVVIDVGSEDVSLTIGETPFAHVLEKVEIRGTPKSSNSPTVLRLSNPTMQGVRTMDEEGRASIASLPPGQYEVAVTKGLPLAVVGMTVQGAKQSGGILTIPETGEVNLTVIADASASRDISGRVVRGDKPEGGLLVTLVPAKNWENTTAYRFDQSDSDGTFAWRAVPPGEYLMFAFEDGEPQDYASAEAIRRLESKAQRIIITGDAKQTVVVRITAR